MESFKNRDEILDFAINREQQAADFYRELAGKTGNKTISSSFELFAKEEEGHKLKLQNIKNNEDFNLPEVEITDLKISDYTENVEPSEDMTYQEALILAMQREKLAFRFYNDLASKTSENKLKNLFLQLAMEESKHKLMFELEYDNLVLKDN